MPSRLSWAPNEDPQTLLAERGWLQGMIVSAIAYGINVGLYLLSFNLLVRKKNRIGFKQRLFLLIYTTLSFLLGTLFMVSLSGFTQKAFIDDRNYPGGPNAFENTFFSIPLDEFGSVSCVLSNWLSDAVVVWRFKVIYQPVWRVPLWIIMALPCLMLAASVGLGIMFLDQISTTNPYETSGINFTLPYLGLSLGLNISLTIAIVIRLLIFRYHLVSVMGAKSGSHYVSMATMIIESVAIYSVVSVSFLVLFGIGNSVSLVFLQSLVQFQTIATLLIVFRVAQGKAWNEGTALHVMTARQQGLPEAGRMEFALHQSSKLGSSEGLENSPDGTADAAMANAP